MIRGTDDLLGTGHISPLEVDGLVRRAKELKIKVVVNSVSTDMPGIPLADQRGWADEDIFMEHVFMSLTDVPHHPTPIASVVMQIYGDGGLCKPLTRCGADGERN